MSNSTQLIKYNKLGKVSQKHVRGSWDLLVIYMTRNCTYTLIDRMKKKMKRRQECLLRDLVTGLILCNNVTPVEDDGQRVLQASSPDEIALVKFAE